MRLLGVGRDGINLFCGLMDIGQGLSKSTYDLIVGHIRNAAKAVFDVLCQKAVKEEKEENEKRGRPSTNLKVSGDGSWKKRGFTSLFGVTTLIAYYSGKVIDLVIKSSYCQACTVWRKREGTEEYANWYENHQEECASNHDGSAGKMEVDAVKEMFSTSENKYGVKYGNYIGDGDSKTFKAILDLNPYGDDFPVSKNECIGHVEKRIGSRLRNIKKEKKLGGKGKLTDVLIKKLTKYYGLAIRRNIESVDGMEKAIMATYLHLCSTNENPRHENCPEGADSWCKYRVAQALGTHFNHPPPLHPDIAKNILPIYENLSKKDLLERCLGGHTQNANESFNSTIWRLAPKHLHSGVKIIEIAAYITAGIFNEGYFAVLKIMEILQIKIGPQCKLFADNYKVERTKRQERRSFSSSREARLARKQRQIEQNELFEEAEGILYGPGIAD
ncbi:uncharacterized protein [Temnothorax nylanderi]|uniref:uncharacterized protein n=1 Tax=Temnothorax nylanderi TaxID=102681 RepID=UPI003A8520AD